MASQHTPPPLPPKGHFHLAGRTFPRIKWWKDKNMRNLYFYIFILSFCNTANGFDNSMMNGLQAIQYWQTYFNHPSGSILGLMSCIMSVGAICGLTFIPFILDRYGRKHSLIGGAILMVIGIVLQVAAQNIGMFVGARFILGLGDIIVICTFPMLVTEIAPSQDRAVLVTLSTTTYNVGAFIAAWVTFGTFRINSNWSWRLTSLLQLPFTLLLLVFIYWIPESPRYYMARDRPEKALQILAHYHANGNEHDEVVQLEYTEIATALALEKEANAFSYLDFLRTPGNRKRLLIILTLGLFSQWSGNALISYYLTPILNTLGITSAQTQLGINAGLTSWNLVINVFFSTKVDSWGRRPLNLSGCAIMLVMFLIWTVLSAIDAKNDNSDPKLGTAIIVLIFFYYLGYALKYCSQASYTSEILPYHMRSKGYSLMEYGLYSVLFFNQFVDATAIENIHWRFYIVFVVFLVVETLIVYFFYVETRYVPLEEITKLFDGDDIATLTNAQIDGEVKLAPAVSLVENAAPAEEKA